MKNLLALVLTLSACYSLSAQKATIRGNVYDAESGEPVAFATVQLAGTTTGTTTDFDGFFTLSNLEAGSYEVISTFVGYDTARAEVTLLSEDVNYLTLNISEGVSLGTVEVSAGRTQARTDVQVSSVTLTPRDIKSLPSTGGDADLAQYLPVLPGIVTTGDQGGQIYIRGGAPIQNKVLLDGVTIFNPFHSIGFYSVFETEAIRNVDVLTGGFGAQYGGRLSAIVDINTKTGNRKDFSGLVGVSPFQGRALLEGPIAKLKEGGGGSTSYLVSAKRGYLDETSPTLYSYANSDSLSLPYNYTDLYGKVSVLGGNGSLVEFFAFDFSDNSNLAFQTTEERRRELIESGQGDRLRFNWTTFGTGMNFKLVPQNSNLIIDGNVSFSDYESEFQQPGEDIRTSSLTNYLAKVNFNNFSGRNTLRYGFAFNGIRTNFRFRNGFGTVLEPRNDNTEVAAYFTFKRAWDKLVIEPGVRLQYYASQSELLPEPRLGIKWNATDFMRFKFAGGLFSQNLLSSVNETDVVNLFVGFISGPEETVRGPDGRPLSNRLQQAVHAIGGVEFDLAPGVLLNVEPYWKDFTRLLAINRNKRTTQESDFVAETGDAYGLDLSLAYDRERAYVFAAYSWGRVNRDDGEQVFPTIFDRRHNANLLATYTLGEKENYDVSFRYNFGTGFPFTATSGFYAREDFASGLATDIAENNPDLGILFSETRNGNRLPNYHRVDISAKRVFEFGDDLSLEVVASVTNTLNRDNIFFVDRINNERVDQLPILPSLGATFRW